MDDTCIFEVTEVRPEYVDAVSRLLAQLSSSQHVFTSDEMLSIIENASSHLFLLRFNNYIAGMLTVCLTLSPTGYKMWIEDVVVDSSFRGRSFGRKLMEYAIDYARKFGNATIMLTSRPVRVEANALYKSVGFIPKETNVYMKKNIKH